MTKAKAAVSTPLGAVAFAAIVGIIKDRKMSERGAAAAAGLDPTCLSAARANGGVLALPSIEKFAKALDVPIGVLLGYPAAGQSPTNDNPITMLALDQIMPSKLNPRQTFDEAKLSELAASIREQGLLQNLVVKDTGNGLYAIVAGERRYHALKKLVVCDYWKADEANIPCRVAAVTDADHLALALLENLQREDVNPMEEAEGFARLHAIDPKVWSTEAIAQRIGTTQRHVQMRLALVRKLSPEAQKALRGGKISLAQAKVLTTADEKQQKAIIKEAGMYGTAERVRDVVQRNWVRAKEALFDTEKHQDFLHWDDDASVMWFTDRGKFMELQGAAVDALVEGAKKRFAWAERMDWFHDMKTVRANPVTKGGFVAVLRHDGSVGTWEGIIKEKETAAGGQGNAKRINEAHKVMVGRRQADAASLTATFAANLNSRDALRLAIYRDLDDGNDFPMELVTKGALRPIADLMEAVEYAPGQAALKRDADRESVWLAILQLDDGELGEAFAKLIAFQCADARQSWPLSPPLCEIAKRLDLSVSPTLLLDRDSFDAEVRRLAALPPDQMELEDAIDLQEVAA